MIRLDYSMEDINIVTSVNTPFAPLEYVKN